VGEEEEVCCDKVGLERRDCRAEVGEGGCGGTVGKPMALSSYSQLQAVVVEMEKGINTCRYLLGNCEVRFLPLKVR